MAGELRKRRGGTDAPDSAHEAEILAAKEEAARALAKVEELQRQLREARGDGDDVGEAVDATKQTTEAAKEPEKETVLRDMQDVFQQLRQGPKPGLSNEAKQAKDALMVDPYCMEAIYNLGVAYAADQKWTECMNVLLRGWKRVREFSDVDRRLDFLFVLCQASFQLEKYRQALAVLSDVDPSDVTPEHPDFVRYEVIKAQVYSMNGDRQKALQAFHTAVDNLGYQRGLVAWSVCCSAFSKAGFYDTAKAMMLDKATSQEDRKKLDAAEALMRMKESILEAQDRAKAPSRWPRYLSAAVFVLVVIQLIWLEQRSFGNWK